jgi:hypothetical protein
MGNNATWPPDEAFASGTGRFDLPGVPTLYLAETQEAAAAEFYRRHPEFLAGQGTIAQIRIYEVDVEVNGPVLDLSTPAKAAAAGIAFDRLRSSEPDETDRYRECRALADRYAPQCTGLLFPSAALPDKAVNLVLFGSGSADTWTSLGIREVSVPILDPSDVAVLPPAILVPSAGTRPDRRHPPRRRGRR